MSSTPPEQGPPIPPGYKPGDYVPFTDRDPNDPTSITQRRADPALQAQKSGRGMTPAEHFRAIYGQDAPVPLFYASWGRRVLGYLVDSFFAAVASIPLAVGYWMAYGELEFTTDAAGNRAVSSYSEVSNASIGVLVLGAVIALAFGIWNLVLRQGRTGCSLGKTVVGIRLVDASTRLPVGAAISFLRQLAHILDSLICDLGWLWPLWDARRQTFADKITGTVVIIQPADGE